MSDDIKDVSRRGFLKNAALGATIAGGALAGINAEAGNKATGKAEKAHGKTMIGVPFEKKDVVKMGIIGVGGRGMGHVHNLLGIENLELRAICDIDAAKVERAKQRVVKAGQKEPAGYTKGPKDYVRMMEKEDLDLVYIATPWDVHVPMAVAAMVNGKHACIEVPAAQTMEECWEMVENSEKTRQHCIMLENCCYGENELMVLHMVRQGAFGELKHGEAAYIHNLRGVLTENRSEGLWRRFPHTKENGNLYPSHGLGPVATYMGINRGDRFSHMVSMSSLELSLTKYVKEHFPEGDPKRQEKYICGDMNTSLIKTVNGLTLMLQHDVVSPRPYDRLNMLSGTKACFRDYPARIFFDGQKHDDWQPVDEVRVKYQHPFWAKLGELARKSGGHGGMDYLMSWRMVQCVREGLVPDMDVYDAAAWSAPKPLSEASVAKGSAPQEIPDFTRGGWKESRPNFI